MATRKRAFGGDTTGITNLREAPIRRRKGHHRFETVSAHRQCKPRGQRREEERDEDPELRSAAAPWTEQRELDAVNQEISSSSPHGATSKAR